MRKSIKALAITSTVIAGLVVAPALYAHDARRLYRLTAPGEIFFESRYPTVDRFTMPGGIEELELHAHTAASGNWWQRIAWTATSPGASHVGMAR